jgi:hypothetical protein
MKIGFSLGRCIRDIVNGDVNIDDVAFLITATHVREVTHLENVIYAYMEEPGYLLGLDYEKCKEVARQLWDTNRILQPRAQGMHRHAQPENSIWVDIFPTVASGNESVKNAWDAYRFMIHMVENVDMEATEVFKT